MSDFRLIGRVTCVDGVTRDVYEDADGRQWVFGESGRLYGRWLLREANQSRPAEAESPSADGATGSRPAWGNEPRPPLAGTSAKGADWFVRSHDEEVGPFTIEELKAKAVAGVLGPEDWVRKGNEEWDLAKTYPFLTPLFNSSPVRSGPNAPKIPPSPPTASVAGSLTGDAAPNSVCQASGGYIPPTPGAPGARCAPPRGDRSKPRYDGLIGLAVLSSIYLAVAVVLVGSSVSFRQACMNHRSRFGTLAALVFWRGLHANRHGWGTTAGFAPSPEPLSGVARATHVA